MATRARTPPGKRKFRRPLEEEPFYKWRRGQKLSEGAFGNVYVARHEETGEVAALKKIPLEGEYEGIPGTILREISLLRELRHPNIVHLIDVFHLRSSGALYLAFEWCEHDLKKYMRSQQYRLSAAAIRSFAYQMLVGLSWCHAHRVLHRDVKPQNILVQPRGMLKLADFGLARAFTVPLRTYTHEVVTLWYRAPEILLGATQYACPVDVWSVGAIIPEMVTGVPLFPGDSEIDELFKIFRVLGTPNETAWQGIATLADFQPIFPKWPPSALREVMPHTDRIDDAGVRLVQRLLAYAPEARPSARNALDDPYFEGVDRTTFGRVPLAEL